ncbi:unnamed protein product [Ilex paraguariensis]|uniref:Uncharacterized protein n=1 Tax=Ilex paraguariensis TaxID=185542 RepID=A0ABC8QU22_9AQUA
MIHVISQNLRRIKPSTINGSLFSAPSFRTSNRENSTDPQSLTLSFLSNSCGFSSESASSTCRKLNIGKKEQSDSVLILLKSHGLKETDIRYLITSRPAILMVDANKTLNHNIELLGSLGFSGTKLVKIINKLPRILETSKAKLVVEFFTAYGFSEEQITDMILRCPKLFSYWPTVLKATLENRLISGTVVLKRIVLIDENVLKAIRADICIIRGDLKNMLEPNFRTLISLGVPKANILKSILFRPRWLLRRPEQFSKIVQEVTILGFDPKKMKFVLALHSLSSLSRSKCEEKIKVFSSFGLSRDEFFLAFELQSICMLTSAKKFRKIMSFFVQKLNFQPSSIFRHPNLFLLSLEKRIIPGCSVLQLLMSKDLFEWNNSLMRVFLMTEKIFLENFVTKYQHLVPEVVKGHECKREFQGFNLNQPVKLFQKMPTACIMSCPRSNDP